MHLLPGAVQSPPAWTAIAFAHLLVAPRLAPGARCDGQGASCDYDAGYTCAPNGTCTKISVSKQVGAPCNDNELRCAYDLYCKTEGTTPQGTCQTDLGVGAPCTSSETCGNNASCRNKVCTAPDPLLCNKQ